MQYAVSDIHGNYGKYVLVLKELGLWDQDQDDKEEKNTLYVIGDMVDRGPHGLRILLDAVSRPSVVPLMGNHEYDAMRNLAWLLNEVNDSTMSDEANVELQMAESLMWVAVNGGQTTLDEFKELAPEDQLNVLKALDGLPLYKEVHTDSNDFILVHAGLPSYDSTNEENNAYSVEELLMVRPTLENTYYGGKIVVAGHTPTRAFWYEDALKMGKNNPLPKDKIYRKGDFIDIDCGCINSDVLGCLCLDTLEEIYF